MHSLQLLSVGQVGPAILGLSQSWIRPREGGGAPRLCCPQGSAQPADFVHTYGQVFVLNFRQRPVSLSSRRSSPLGQLRCPRTSGLSRSRQLSFPALCVHISWPACVPDWALTLAVPILETQVAFIYHCNVFYFFSSIVFPMYRQIVLILSIADFLKRDFSFRASLGRMQN